MQFIGEGDGVCGCASERWSIQQNRVEWLVARVSRNRDALPKKGVERCIGECMGKRVAELWVVGQPCGKVRPRQCGRTASEVHRVDISPPMDGGFEAGGYREHGVTVGGRTGVRLVM